MLIALHLLKAALVYVLLPIAAVAQDLNFTIPSDWRKAEILNSSSERITIAQNAVKVLKNGIESSNGTTSDLDTWQSANVLASIAQLDYVSGTQEDHDLVRQSVTAFQKSRPDFFDTQDPRDVTNDLLVDSLMWGLAAFYGARAYGNDTDLLEASVSVWSLVQAYVVDDQGVVNATQQNVSCEGPSNANSSLAGAVFAQVTGPQGHVFNAETAGAFVALSAHLWDATRNMTYLTFAESSAQFIYNHLYSNDSQIVRDSFDLTTCSILADEKNRTSDQGFLIEGLSILSVAPLSTNSTWGSMMRALVSSTIPSPLWTTPDGTNAGILFEGPDGESAHNSTRSFNFKNIYIGALLEIWSQTPSSDNMTTFIEAFIAVQFNALQELASSNDTYSPIWTGPPPSKVVPWGQLAAIPVLNAALKMASNPSPPPNATVTIAPSPTSSKDPPSGSNASSSSRSLSGGAIAGIVIGSVGGFVLVVASVFIAVRYKRRLAKERQVAYQSFVPSAMYRKPAETTGVIGLPPVEDSWKDREGYGSGQRYLTERDSIVEHLAASPLAEQSSAE